MGKIKRLDRGPGWMNRDLSGIKREQQKQRPARRTTAGTAVGTVRELLTVMGLLKVTGRLSVDGDEGREMLRAGYDGAFGRVLEFLRSDSSTALRFYRPFSTDSPQILELCDRGGWPIIGESALGNGLGKPNLEVPFQPHAASTGTALSTMTYGPHGWERATSSTSWDTLFVTDTYGQNRFIDFKFAAICSDGTTAGEVRIVDLNTGVPLPGFLSTAAWIGAIPTGTTTLAILDPTPDKVESPVAAWGGYVGMQMRIGVQVRRTAGSGSISLAIAQSIGA